MKEYFLSAICLAAILTFISCGSGDYTIDPDQGIESQVGDTTSGGTTGGGTTGGGGTTPQQYFTDNLWPLMKLTATNGTGCANSSCHGNVGASNQTFFKVDAASATNSWNWASVRRRSVDTSTGYAGPSSVTLKSKMDSSHNTFRSWTTAQKTLLNNWVALP